MSRMHTVERHARHILQARNGRGLRVDTDQQREGVHSAVVQVQRCGSRRQAGRNLQVDLGGGGEQNRRRLSANQQRRIPVPRCQIRAI